MNTLQERLKAIRGNRTQAVFAKEIGIPLTTLGRYERGENKPDLDFIGRLHLQYGISLDWLAFGKGQMYDRRAHGEGENASSHMEMHAQCKCLLDQLGMANDRLHQAGERERLLLKENSQLREEMLVLRTCPYCNKDEGEMHQDMRR